GTSAATNAVRGFQASITTPDSITIAEATGFVLASIVLGSGTTIARCQDLICYEQSVGTNRANLVLSATGGSIANNYTGIWNIYSDSTRASSLGGHLLLGTTTDSAQFTAVVSSSST